MLSYPVSLHNSIPNKTPSPAHLFPSLPVLKPVIPVCHDMVVPYGSLAMELQREATQEVK